MYGKSFDESDLSSILQKFGDNLQFIYGLNSAGVVVAESKRSDPSNILLPSTRCMQDQYIYIGPYIFLKHFFKIIGQISA